LATKRESPREYEFAEVVEVDRNDAFNFISVILIFGTIIGIIVGLVWWGGSITTNNDYDLRLSRIDAAFQQVPGETDAIKQQNRQELAKQWLQLQQSKVLSDLTDNETDTIKATADNGQEPQLPYIHRDGRHEFWEATQLLLAGLWLLFSLLTFVTYACQSVDRDRFLLDFRWRYVWPVPFVFFTAIPFGWPFYLVSAVRLGLFKYRQAHQPHEEVRVAQIPVAQAAMDQDDEEAPQPVFTFHSSPNAARVTYRELRTSVWKRAVEKRRAKAVEKKKKHEARLRELGEELKASQGKLNDAKATIKELDEAPLETENMPDLQHLDSEFDRLISLPGVYGVRVINDGLSLYIKARITYEGTRYDLGDWELRFGTEASLQTIELRSGVRHSWGGHYPVYRLGDGSFCLGSRAQTIHENITKGQFLQALELAIDCIQSVNPEDSYRIPHAFKEAKD
jgi:hypothetical protein